MNRYFLYLILVLLTIHPAKAQENLLTIDKAVQLALERNPGINRERSVLAEKKEKWRTLTGVQSPELVYLKEGINRKEPVPFAEQRYAVSQSLEFPVSAVYRVQAAKKEVSAQEMLIKAMEKDLTVNVKGQYVEVLYALHLQKLRRLQIDLANNLYKAVYSKFETGLGNGIDLIKAEIQVAEAQNDLDDSEKTLHTARYNLFNFIGLNPQEQKYTIQFTDSLRAYEERISQQQALNFLEEQPLFKSATMEADAAGDKIKSAKNRIFPDMRFDLYRQDYGNGFKYNGFEIGLKFPLWYGLDLKGNIRSAQNVRDQLLWNQQEVKLDLKREVEHAWHGYITSKTTLERYRSTIKGRADKLQSLTIEAYRLGEIDLVNLINSQQIYLNSQLRFISALRDYFRQMVSLEKFLDIEIVY